MIEYPCNSFVCPKNQGLTNFTGEVSWQRNYLIGHHPSDIGIFEWNMAEIEHVTFRNTFDDHESNVQPTTGLDQEVLDLDSISNLWSSSINSALNSFSPPKNSESQPNRPPKLCTSPEDQTEDRQQQNEGKDHLDCLARSKGDMKQKSNKKKFEILSSGTQPKISDDLLPNYQCDLYLAPSSIPGAGLGIFTGKEYKVDDPIDAGDVAIVVYGFSHDVATKNGESRKDPFANYVWDPLSLGLHVDEDLNGPGLFWPGINAAVNCNPALNNLKLTLPEYDVCDVHRFHHPAAGAFSPYHKGVSLAARNIPMGGELFKDYGEGYFLTRDAFDGVPVASTFDTSYNLLQLVLKFINNHVSYQRSLYDLSTSMVSLWDQRLFHALPTTFDSANELMKRFDGDFGENQQANHTRDVSWLIEHGRCIDNIVPKQSSLVGAGRGAFAKRFLSKGSVMTSSPLILVPRDMLTRTKIDLNGINRTQHDLILNYCFGSSISSLLLCPYSAGISYINHNRTLANVRVQWASQGSLGHDEGNFEIPPWQFDFIERHPSLVLDYIVTKDIAPDEEIFLDYGDEFEEAWGHYVANWRPEAEWESYISAHDFNQVVTNDGLLRTADEQWMNPYPENLILHCHSKLQSHSMKALLRVGLNLKGMDDMKQLFPWYDQDTTDVDFGVPCEIVNRMPVGHSFLYDVRLTVVYETGDSTLIERAGVPREAFHFFDRPKTKDYELTSSFRHAIGLPKEMIPHAWRDIAE